MKDFKLTNKEIQEAMRNLQPGQREVQLKQEGPFKTVERWTGQTWERVVIYEPRY